MLVNSKKIVINDLIAAIYALSTMLVGEAGFGRIQFRPGEALTILPLLVPSSWIGLTVGCIIANLMSFGGLFDVIIGSSLTLIASLITMIIGKLIKKETPKVVFGCLPPIFINAFGIPLIFYLTELTPTYSLLAAATLIASQSLTICMIGIPVYYLAKKSLKKAA